MFVVSENQLQMLHIAFLYILITTDLRWQREIFSQTQKY